jgi:hypothetical protein
MRRYLFATLSILAVVAASGAASAGGRHYRHAGGHAIQDAYCLQGRIWGYPGNCQFSSYGQCMASASGTDAYCGVNPMRAYGAAPYPYR